jgi:hypothetical protein
MALACDLRVATTGAYVQEKFVNIGLMPDGGGTFWLPRLVGTARALKAMLLSEKLEAARRSIELGLLAAPLVPPDEPRRGDARARAQKIEKGPPLAFRRAQERRLREPRRSRGRAAPRARGPAAPLAQPGRHRRGSWPGRRSASPSSRAPERRHRLRRRARRPRSRRGSSRSASPVPWRAEADHQLRERRLDGHVARQRSRPRASSRRAALVAREIDEAAHGTATPPRPARRAHAPRASAGMSGIQVRDVPGAVTLEDQPAHAGADRAADQRPDRAPGNSCTDEDA